MPPIESVCVFCGSNPGLKAEYAQSTRLLGQHLAEAGIAVVYGGGNIGLMGILADTALKAGGRVVGVIPRLLTDKEMAHPDLSELHVVDSMHERKALMAERSDGFIALPGGIGTYEEFFEMLTWTQLKIHPKPCGLLNILGYWDPLLSMLDHSVSEGFLKPKHRSNVLVGTNASDMVTRLQGFRR